MRLAERTAVRVVHSQAPRGFILDRHGELLVGNRTSLTVAVDVSRLPDGRSPELVRALAKVLDLSEGDVRQALEDPRLPHYAPRPVAVDVDEDVVIALLEHRRELSGVEALELAVREYPHGPLAAHVLGHIGTLSGEDQERLSREDDYDYRPGDKVGKLGVERVYERWLRGRPGFQKIVVDVRGERVRELASRQPERGWDGVLTLDASLQRAAEDALRRGIELARTLRDPDTGRLYEAPAGALVALDPRTGEVLTLTSHPTFDPNLFVGPVSPRDLSRLNDPAAGLPLFNRAIAESVPPGSTFKPITAAAAWDAGIVSPDRRMFDPGFLKIGNRVFRGWKPGGHGTVDLRKSLVESVDTYYYTLGIELDAQRGTLGERLQTVARSFGLGRTTGVDIPGERRGLVPDAGWKRRRFADRPSDGGWFAGDAANLAIGQGYLQASPLQLAVAYAALANGGLVRRPYLLRCLAELDVSRPLPAEQACSSGMVPDGAGPAELGRVEAAVEALRFIGDSLSGVVRGSGTAAEAFEGFPLERVPVAGKTGTSQMQPRQPFSWFAAFAPADAPEIVVVALVEEGGTGAEVAAPIARRVLEKYFGIPQGEIEAGSRAD